jgi:hypothetical protein
MLLVDKKGKLRIQVTTVGLSGIKYESGVLKGLDKMCEI